MRKKIELDFKEWSEIYRRCRASNKPVSSWLKENGVSVSYYYHGRKLFMEHLFDQSKPGNGSVSGTFDPGEIPNDELFDADILLRIENWKIEIKNSADPVLVSLILGTVIHSA